MQLAAQTAAIKAEILKALGSDQLELPVLPEVALRIRDAADDPEVTVGRLAQVVSQDPALSARIVKVANSPLMRGAQAIENLQNAISRLGVKFSANLATGFAMEQMFQATSEAVDEALHEVWTHSTQVAAMSCAITRKYTKLKPDQAMLAGLTHAIGALPVLAWAERDDRLSESAAVLSMLIDAVHQEIGSAILASWEFPAELMPIPKQYTQFDRSAAKADYVDVVMVANLEVYKGTKHPLSTVDHSAVSAYTRLGMDPTATDTDLQDLAKAIGAAMH